MNVCLVSSAPGGRHFRSKIVDQADLLGYRTLVLFTRPQHRFLWRRGRVVFFSPASGLRSLKGRSLEGVVRRSLEGVRALWLSPLPAGQGPVAYKLLSAEQMVYRAFMSAGLSFAGHTEALAARFRRSKSEGPFSGIPQGLAAYGVLHALDAACEQVTLEAAAESGAVYLGPATVEVKAAYEDAVMQWLKA